MDVAQNSDVTLAAAVEPQLEQGREWNIGPSYFSRLIFARPCTDIPLAQVKVRLAALWPDVAALDPNASFKTELALPPDLIPGGTGSTALRNQFRRPLLVLMALVGLVLLIACANIANLLLARASARQREIAVRLAIGAGRGRIIRQLLTESALLSSCGAALGIGLAWFGSSFVVELFSSGQNYPVMLDVAPHGHVLIFTILVAVATAMLFGIAPAFRATSAGPVFALRGALKDASTQVAGSRTRLASTLVVLQVSVSLLLLVGAGLFVGTLRNLRHLDAGFRHEGVLIVEMNRTGTGRRSLLDRIGRLPGVVSASFSNNTVLSGGSITSVASLPGGAPVTVDSDWIGPGYFETLRTPILEGREFTLHDDKTAPRVAIVNQTFVRNFFPDGHPLGRHFLTDLPPVDTQIVGVVEDARSHSLRDPALPAVYVPSLESGGFGNFEVRVAGSIAQVVSELRRELHPAEIYPLTEQVEKTLVRERLMATLAGSFGALALILASIGLYGLLAYAVARRTNEIGIRMALGAERADVLRMVIRDALRLLGWGVALGLPAAWAASRWVSSMLFGLTPMDAGTILAATALLAGFGLLAGFLPALRASRVDPMVALRYE
jgi:predicted permease